MARVHDEQTIALAGMCQAASLVDQIATRGMVPQNSLETSINSLFVMNPAQTEDVFGGAREIKADLQLGFRILQDLLEKRSAEQNRNLANYLLSMIALQKKLTDNTQMLNHLGKRLDEIEEKARYFAAESGLESDHPGRFTHPSIIAALDGLYQETISTFSFRIQVGGDPRHLQNAENAAKIRALLLAGIRAAMLWRQVGGKRWHLLMLRGRTRDSLHKILGH